MASKSNGIDYSKWDKMDFSDDDDTDDNDEKGMTMPRVTRLDTPSSITTTRDGTVQITKNTSPPTKIESTTKNSSCSSKEDSIRQERINDEMNKKEKEEWTQNGDSFIDEQFHQKIQTYWCQDRYEVILSIVIVDDDDTTTATEKEHNNNKSLTNRQYQVNVKGPLLVSYADRFSAMGVGTTKQSTTTSATTENQTNTILTVVSSLKRNHNNNHHHHHNYNDGDKKRIVFQGMLPHPIHLAEDEENVEWELVSHHAMKKVLRITFQKALPMQGLTMWWDRPLLHFPKINLQTDIQGRNSSSIKDNTKMKQVWDEAHTLFREKMKQKKKEEP